MNKKTIARLTALGTLIGVATAVTVISIKKKRNKEIESSTQKPMLPNRNIYFAGGGLSALATAFYLIHDCNISGESIYIFEGSENIGGIYNYGGDFETGYVCTPSKFIPLKNSPNLFNMLSSLKSANVPNMTVKEELFGFNKDNKMNLDVLLINENGQIANDSFQISQEERKLIKSLLIKNDNDLSKITINSYFKNNPEFLKSNLWAFVSSLYMLLPYSSALELKKTLSSIADDLPKLFEMNNSLYSQYSMQDTVIKSLENYLESHNVNFATHCQVTDIDFESDTNNISAIHLNDNGTIKTFYLNKHDLFFVTNGSTSECATIGDYNYPAPLSDDIPYSYYLWKQISEKKDSFGLPKRFFESEENSEIVSFTATFKSRLFIDLLEKTADSSKPFLINLKNSPWNITIQNISQPYFVEQPENIFVISGYGLNTLSEGKYIDKALKHSSGAEILFEITKSLGYEDSWEEISKDVINVIPCLIPYYISPTFPYVEGDKPQINNNTNFAFIGQYVDIPDAIVNSCEYSVKTGRYAAYKLTATKKSTDSCIKSTLKTQFKFNRFLKN